VARRRRAVVVDADGVVGHLRTVRVHEPDKAVAVIELERGAIVEVPFELLEHHAEGGYSLAARWRELVQKTRRTTVIPMVAERVVTEIREVPRQRLRRRVVSEEKVVETPYSRERIDIERVPMNTYVERPPEPRWEGDTMILPCVEEVVVVEKRLRIREEIRIRLVRERHVDRRTLVLRHHEIEMESEKKK
jgi:hypothetical protein